VDSNNANAQHQVELQAQTLSPSRGVEALGGAFLLGLSNALAHSWKISNEGEA